MKIEDLDYHDGSLLLRGVLVYDETIKGKRPGIVVVHEAWGLGQHVIESAKKLAGLGYVALAADMYGDRRQFSDLAEVMKIINELTGTPSKIRNRIGAALTAIAAQPQVDSRRLGAIGYCFGGSTVLELARSGAEIAGVVSFHGILETKAPATAGAVKASVLVCTGADDPMIPTAQVTAFANEMRNAGADWQVILYGGTVHSFTNPQADGSFAPAILYNARSDQRSGTAMREFFEEIFAQ
jgi:dienelactone hydrolase